MEKKGKILKEKLTILRGEVKKGSITSEQILEALKELGEKFTKGNYEVNKRDALRLNRKIDPERAKKYAAAYNKILKEVSKANYNLRHAGENIQNAKHATHKIPGLKR